MVWEDMAGAVHLRGSSCSTGGYGSQLGPVGQNQSLPVIMTEEDTVYIWTSHTMCINTYILYAYT